MVVSGRVIYINILVLFLLIPSTEFNMALAEVVPNNGQEECVPIGSWKVPGGEKYLARMLFLMRSISLLYCWEKRMQI